MKKLISLINMQGKTKEEVKIMLKEISQKIKDSLVAKKSEK